MSDLQLESTNNAGETTMLVAVPHDRGANLLMDFVGDVILDVRPTRGLLVAPKDGGFPVTPDPNKNDFGGIRCAGVGTGAGLRAESQAGRGVWGVGSVGVLGVGSGQNAIGVHGTNEGSGVGVRGEGNPGVVGSSARQFRGRGRRNALASLGNCSANPTSVGPDSASGTRSLRRRERK